MIRHIWQHVCINIFRCLIRLSNFINFVPSNYQTFITKQTRTQIFEDMAIIMKQSEYTMIETKKNIKIKLRTEVVHQKVEEKPLISVKKLNNSLKNFVITKYKNGDVYYHQANNSTKGILVFGKHQERLYKGEFKNGKFDGAGEQYVEDELVFSGKYENGYRKQGRQICEQGIFYGGYKLGAKFRGYMISRDQKQIKCGEWFSGVFVKGHVGRVGNRITKSSVSQTQGKQILKYKLYTQKLIEQFMKNQQKKVNVQIKEFTNKILENPQELSKQIKRFDYILIASCDGFLIISKNTAFLFSRQIHAQQLKEQLKYQGNINHQGLWVKNKQIYHCYLLRFYARKIIKDETIQKLKHDQLKQFLDFESKFNDQINHNYL